MTESRHNNLPLGRGIFLRRLGLSLSVALFTLVQLRTPEPANGQVSTSKRGVQVTSVRPAAAAASGTYYALVIGNDDYRYLPKLKTAVADANAIAQLLRERYGFTTNVLLDSSRNRILTALNEYRRILAEDSPLLIYYAGHGHHDPDTDKAYWLPVTAQRFVVLHYGGADASQACVGEMWVDGGMIHYRALRGSHGIHSYDFPAQIVKKVKKNSLIGSAYQAFHVRLTSGEVYNFSLLDSSLKTFLNADSLLIAVHQGLEK